jgi:excisionase family DNA binding protein
VSAGVGTVSLGVLVVFPANYLNEEVIDMKNPNPKNMPTLNKEEEAVIHAIAEKLGERISQVVAPSLSEMLSLINEKRRQPTVQQDNFTHSAPEFLTASDIAKELKISKSLAYHMIKTKEIPTFSIGRTVRIRRADLDSFVEAHTIR